MRREKAAASNEYYTQDLKKDGTPSKLRDSRKTWPSLEDAKKHRDNITKLNPHLQNRKHMSIHDAKTGEEITD